ncbi:MAG: ribonucleoside triphosphate reductase, partial [Bacilli bacterium]
MIKTVIKRSGRKQDFEKGKIVEAIKKAILSVRQDIDEKKAEELSKLATGIVVFKLNEKGETIIHLEDIQNVVEETLMNLGMTDVARSYIRYRFQRELLRKDKETGISVEKMMSNYIKKDDWLVKENANMDYSLQGLNNYIVSDITKNFWLNHIFTKEQKDAHENGDIHIHDLGLLAPYCCGWDMEDILKSGFTGVKNKAQTKPAKHLKTALGQLVNFFYTLQGEAAGAQAISSLDTYCAPFIRYDNLTYKDVKQNIQEFIFNLSVPTRVGFQTPFVNVTLDLTPSPLLKDTPVIIGGKPQDTTYGEYQKEMDMFNKAFCEVMVEGDASGRVFTFPIPTYNITKDFDWDSEVANEIMKMTSKYGIPYFANFINSDMKPEDARSMCCRLRLDNRELRKRGGGLFGANPLTGSVGIVTVNLPRLGYLYKNKTDFKK